MFPLISLITVCRNPGSSIERTFNSIRTQTYTNFEYIVVDGVSDDGTIEWLTSSERKEYISRFITEPDHGIYDAINKGILMAKGEVIGILHAGDEFDTSETLKYLVDVYFTMAKHLDVISGSMKLSFPITGKYKYLHPSKDALLKLESRMSLFHPSTFITRKAYEKYGLYDPSYTIVGDHELLRRFWLNGANFYILDKCLVKMEYGGISTQYKHAITCATERARINCGNSNSIRKVLFGFVVLLKRLASITKARIR